MAVFMLSPPLSSQKGFRICFAQESKRYAIVVERGSFLAVPHLTKPPLPFHFVDTLLRGFL
jgi:hypothetical protein